MRLDCVSGCVETGAGHAALRQIAGLSYTSDDAFKTVPPPGPAAEIALFSTFERLPAHRQKHRPKRLCGWRTIFDGLFGLLKTIFQDTFLSSALVTFNLQ